MSLSWWASPAMQKRYGPITGNYLAKDWEDNMDFFGNLVGGLKTGLSKGLQYDVDFFRYFADALKRGDKAELADLEACAKQFVHEAADEAGQIKGGIVGQLLGGADPFYQSRQMMKTVKDKYHKP